MLRLLLGLFAAAVLALTVMEFLGVVPEKFGSVARMSDAVSLLTVFIVVFSFWAVGQSWMINRLFYFPLFSTYKRLQRKSDSPTDKEKTAFFRSLAREVSAISVRERALPAQLISTTRQRQMLGNDQWPWELAEIAPWARESSVRIRSNIILRFLLNERLHVVADRLKAVHDYAANFPVSPPKVGRESDSTSEESPVRRLIQAVELHTGASILATGLHTRGGVRSARLWHSDSLSTEHARAHEDDRNSKNFNDLHLSSIGEDSVRCEWEAKMNSDVRYRLGDVDDHVPVLTGVSVAENRWSGDVEFVLSTHSTCRAATDHSPRACKGPLDDLAVGDTQVPFWREVAPGTVTRNPANADAQFESLLTVHTALVMTDENGDRSMILVERGNTHLFGNQMISMPGELIMLPAGGRSTFIDEHGAVEPHRHATHAVTSMLGLTLSEGALRPSHVLMVNQRESSSSASEGRCQLVSTIAYMAQIATTRTELENSLNSTNRLGMLNVQGLQFVPLGSAFKNDLRSRQKSAARFVRWLQDHRESMDQMSSTTALLVAAQLFDSAPVLDALEAGGRSSSSWWESQWSNESSGSRSREAVSISASQVQRSLSAQVSRAAA